MYLGSDEDEEVTLFSKKVVSPPGSDDASSSDDEYSEGEGKRVTMANMEARSRALDEAAAREAELDLEEMQNAVADEGGDDLDMEGDGDDEDGEPFHLPTAEEREEEKKGVSDIHVVQRRMRRCVRILGNFKKLAEKGRSVWTGFLVTHLLSYTNTQVTVGICRAIDNRHCKLFWIQSISGREALSIVFGRRGTTFLISFCMR